jgi:AraC-like DNA-binding protein
MPSRPRHRLERILLTGRRLGLSFVPDCALLDAGTAFPLNSHWHAGYEICYLLSGQTDWVLSNGQALHLSAGMFSIIQPRIPHLGSFHRIDPCELVWLVFRPDATRRGAGASSLEPGLMEKMGAAFKAAGNAVFEGDERLRTVAELFATAVRAGRAGSADAGRRAWLGASLTQIVLAVHGILAGHRRRASAPASGLLGRCDRFVRQHLHRPIGVADMARHANMRTSSFFAHFRRETGMTPADYLRRARLRRAQELMVRTDKPITQIALECGFSSSQYFAVCFKEYTGTQPRSFRERFAGDLRLRRLASPDERPPVVCDDVNGDDLSGLDADR